MTREELQKKIQEYPQGGITYKTINGKQYAYYQWRKNGMQKNRRVQDDELETLSKQIAERKALEEELKNSEVNRPLYIEEREQLIEEQLPLKTKIGKGLKRYAAPVKNWKKRECYYQLEQYVHGASLNRVFILYGLRRTGKTTMLRQLIAELSEQELGQTALIQVQPKDTLSKLYDELDLLAECGFRYIFIDEVTFLEDFIEGGAILADFYAAEGMKVVLSGTDSLGFLFSEDEQLYDRCELLHTTFIPYREFERVLGLQGVDEFIRHGGTMSMSGVNYNLSGTFQNSETAGAYVDTAIAHNIQHSLKNYQNEGHFGSLKELYDTNELTSAINRVVEDMNHEFTLKVLTQDFKSHDLGISKRNMAMDRRNPNKILEEVDVTSVTERLRQKLDILNREELSVLPDEVCREQIRSYLKLLDLIVDIDVVQFSDRGYSGSETMSVISQPGLRYSQAKALIESLLADATFAELSLSARTEVSKRILSEVRGRMLEELILLETKMARPDCEVFKLQFPVGEFDMVVFDPASASCELYEIKHSEEKVPAQYRHLADEEKCAQTAFRYGAITGKYVIYRGESGKSDVPEIDYVNAEEYLRFSS